MSGEKAAARTRGRPRRIETDHAILDAARASLYDKGYERLTIEEVARRAGVGKPTVYRRYASKAELVAAAFIEVLEVANPEVPNTGDPSGDIRRLLCNLVDVLTTTNFGRAMIEIVSPAVRDRQLSEMFHVAAEGRRVVLRTVIQRAADAGRLATADVEIAIDLLLGAIYFRHLASRRVLDSAFVDELVDMIVLPVSDVEV